MGKAERPNTENRLNVWVRDGWFENEGTVLNEIRAEGLMPRWLMPLYRSFVIRIYAVKS